MVKDQHPQAVKEVTASILPVWLEAFKLLLSIDPHQDVVNGNNWDGLAVRIQIFKVGVQSHILYIGYSVLQCRPSTQFILHSLAA
jgi:hypothetical protein